MMGLNQKPWFMLNLEYFRSFCSLFIYTVTLSYLGGGADSAPPLMFFLHHPETAQAMKLKLSDFKDTCLRHILQVILGCYNYHDNKITKGTLQNLTQQKSEIF